MAGGLAGVATWFISYPFDTLKTIIQTYEGGSKSLTQIEAYRKVARDSNTLILGLFKGLSPTLIRAFFVNAVIFYTNDLCHEIFDKKLFKIK